MFFFAPIYLPRRGTLFVALSCEFVDELRRSNLFIIRSIQINIFPHIQFQIFLKMQDTLL